MVQIRNAVPDDATKLLALRRQLDDETQFMMYEPGERQSSEAAQRAELEAMARAGNQGVLVAEVDGRLVGLLEVTGGTFRRNRHSATLVVGVLQAYAGQGIGSRLFAALEPWARERGLFRLELTVMTHNVAALALYRKHGFQMEGLRRESLLVDGACVDEYALAKRLETPMPS